MGGSTDRSGDSSSERDDNGPRSAVRSVRGLATSEGRTDRGPAVSGLDSGDADASRPFRGAGTSGRRPFREPVPSGKRTVRDTDDSGVRPCRGPPVPEEVAGAETRRWSAVVAEVCGASTQARSSSARSVEEPSAWSLRGADGLPSRSASRTARSAGAADTSPDQADVPVVTDSRLPGPDRSGDAGGGGTDGGTTRPPSGGGGTVGGTASAPEVGPWARKATGIRNGSVCGSDSDAARPGRPGSGGSSPGSASGGTGGLSDDDVTPPVPGAPNSGFGASGSAACAEFGTPSRGARCFGTEAWGTPVLGAPGFGAGALGTGGRAVSGFVDDGGTGRLGDRGLGRPGSCPVLVTCSGRGNSQVVIRVLADQSLRSEPTHPDSDL